VIAPVGDRVPLIAGSGLGCAETCPDERRLVISPTITAIGKPGGDQNIQIKYKQLNYLTNQTLFKRRHDCASHDLPAGIRHSAGAARKSDNLGERIVVAPHCARPDPELLRPDST